MSRFAFDDSGSGPPVLLVHGFPATRGRTSRRAS